MTWFANPGWRGAPNRAALDAAPSGGAYTGPGDLAGLSGAYAWWGLRAYNNAVAAAHGNVVRVCNSSGTGAIDITANSDGTITPPGATACGGSACTLVTTLYDQTGNGRHLTQATTASMPTFNGTGVLSMSVLNQFGGTNLFTAALTLPQPFSVSAIVTRVTSNGANCSFMANGGTGAALSFLPLVVGISPGGFSSTNVVTVNVPSAAQFTAIGSGSKINLDGTLTTGASGATAFAGDPLYVLSGSSVDTVKFTEGGVWNTDVSGSFSALNTNQHTFWGF